MRISYWSSDVCSSDLLWSARDAVGGRIERFGHSSQDRRNRHRARAAGTQRAGQGPCATGAHRCRSRAAAGEVDPAAVAARDRAPCRSEEHTSELQSLMRISYAVFCLKKKKHTIDKYRSL